MTLIQSSTRIRIAPCAGVRRQGEGSVHARVEERLLLFRVLARGQGNARMPGGPPQATYGVHTHSQGASEGPRLRLAGKHWITSRSVPLSTPV